MQLSRGFEQLSFQHGGHAESVARAAVQLIPAGRVESLLPPVELKAFEKKQKNVRIYANSIVFVVRRTEQ